MPATAEFGLRPQKAWHYNHVTFTPIAKNFMLHCRLIYMLSMLYVKRTIKVKVGIPESFKVGWYPHKITGSRHLRYSRNLPLCRGGRGAGGPGSIDWRIIKLEVTSLDGEEFKASQSLILAILKLSYKSTYLMSVAFRSIPYSTDGVLRCQLTWSTQSHANFLTLVAKLNMVKTN